MPLKFATRSVTGCHLCELACSAATWANSPAAGALAPR